MHLKAIWSAVTTVAGLCGATSGVIAGSLLLDPVRTPCRAGDGKLISSGLPLFASSEQITAPCHNAFGFDLLHLVGNFPPASVAAVSGVGAAIVFGVIKDGL